MLVGTNTTKRSSAACNAVYVNVPEFVGKLYKWIEKSTDDIRWCSPSRKALWMSYARILRLSFGGIIPSRTWSRYNIVELEAHQFDKQGNPDASIAGNPCFRLRFNGTP